MRGLSWIRVDVDMPEHPKMLQLAEHLGVREAWPYVFRLWCWAAKVAPSGELGNAPARGLAQAAGWGGAPPKFLEGVLAVGLVEATPSGFRLHDWRERYGKYLERLEKDRERKRRKGDDEPSNSAGSSGGVPSPDRAPRARAIEKEKKKDKEQEPRAALAGGAGQLPLLGGMVPPPAASAAPDRPHEPVDDDGRGSDLEHEPEAGSVRPAAGAPPPDGESRPPPAREDEPGPEAAAARAAMRADFDRWVGPARALLGLSVEETPTSPAWHVFAGAKKRKGVRDRYGIERLLRALEGLTGDAFARGAGLRGLLADTLVQKGLARMAERESRGVPPSSSSAPPAPAAPAAPLPPPGERGRTPWGPK